MFFVKVLIRKFLAIYRLPTSALREQVSCHQTLPYDRSGEEAHIATSEITSLKHELRDHTMELGPSVAKTLLASAKGTEILSGLRSDIVVEVEIDAAALFYGEISHDSQAV